MQINQLRNFDGVDLTNRLVHLTFRTQNPNDIDLPPDIACLTPGHRLARILFDSSIRAFLTYGSTQPVVCLSEAVPAAISLLVSDGRYRPWGIALRRQFVFNHGGGPCFYVRGDEWGETHGWPDALKARRVRFWPGAIPTGDEHLPNHLATTSEWIHEREWRVAGDGGLGFSLPEVEFLVLPGNVGFDALTWVSAKYAELGGSADLAAVFAERHVILDNQTGAAIHDPGGFW